MNKKTDKEKYKEFKEHLNHSNISINNKYDEKKKIRRSRNKVIDLHGSNRYEAEDRVLSLLKSYKMENIFQMKIICGRGIHSNDEPVLFQHIKDLLDKNTNYYSRYRMDTNNNITVYWE